MTRKTDLNSVRPCRRLHAILRQRACSRIQTISIQSLAPSGLDAQMAHVQPFTMTKLGLFRANTRMLSRAHATPSILVNNVLPYASPPIQETKWLLFPEAIRVRRILLPPIPRSNLSPTVRLPSQPKREHAQRHQAHVHRPKNAAATSRRLSVFPTICLLRVRLVLARATLSNASLTQMHHPCAEPTLATNSLCFRKRQHRSTIVLK